MSSEVKLWNSSSVHLFDALFTTNSASFGLWANSKSEKEGKIYYGIHSFSYSLSNEQFCSLKNKVL